MRATKGQFHGLRGTGLLTVLLLWSPSVLAEETAGKAGPVDYFGYARCIRLTNAQTSVTLGPQAGGRVLEYSWKGENSLYLDSRQEGWRYEPGKPAPDPCGGRCDIGPEMTLSPRPDLWLGEWTGEILSPSSARMTSRPDRTLGIQLVRDFTLDSASSRLTFTQTIKNVSDKPVSCCHWSRTLAKGGGICLIPLTAGSRFPRSYVQYGPGPVMNYKPDDPNIRVRDGFLEITGTPQRPKLGMDSHAGWFCYLMKNDLMFVKRFAVFPERVYQEMAGLTISIWYFQQAMCELEPIGPRETLAPGQSAQFTEEWWLLPHRFPANADLVKLDEISQLVKKLSAK